MNTDVFSALFFFLMKDIHRKYIVDLTEKYEHCLITKISTHVCLYRRCNLWPWMFFLLRCKVAQQLSHPGYSMSLFSPSSKCQTFTRKDKYHAAISSWIMDIIA